MKGVKTAFFYNWAELINTMNRKYMDEIAFEKNDKYSSNYQKAFGFIMKYRTDPTFVFLYSVHTDHAGHKYKWMSPQYISAIESADTAIGDFLNRLKKENLYKRTHFLLITDHGGTANGHGGVSMNEMQVPWAIAGPKIKKLGSIDNLYNSNKNTSFVIAQIFGIHRIPPSWTGRLLKEIFK